MMKIILTGGGSGGHITPLLAVAHELKALAPETKIIYIGQRGDQLSDIPAADPNIDATYMVWAGKLRRYADEGWLRRLTDVRTIALNLRDISRLARGIWQSYWLLRKLKPAVIFSRGGFVSVPVALGGKLNGVPYITHDSDSVPSLANRLIARWAAKHAVALPIDVYPYPAASTVQVGVPVNSQYQPVTAALQAQYRREIGLEQYKHLVFVTGGGNGAQTLNRALVHSSSYLLSTFPDLAIVHVAGRALETETSVAYDALHLGASRNRIIVYGFITDLHRHSGAADVVIGRAGATNVAEFAIQRKACVMVPPKQLSWAVHNSQVLAKRGAIVELDEDQIEQPERLARTVSDLLHNPQKRRQLADQLAEYAHPQAAAELAALILQTGGREVHVRPQN